MGPTDSIVRPMFLNRESSGATNFAGFHTAATSKGLRQKERNRIETGLSHTGVEEFKPKTQYHPRLAIEVDAVNSLI